MVDREFAREILIESMGVDAASLQQFQTGLSHYVFDARTEDGTSCVIRIAVLERSDEFKRGIYWHAIIANQGVCLPQIYNLGGFKGFPYAIYERLKGDDLENVYPSLSNLEKSFIAKEVAEIQRKITAIDQSFFEPIPPWWDVLREVISRSKKEILSHGLCNLKYVNQVQRRMENFKSYFHSIHPVSFLYDLGVRNVIVDDGKVTGIIDVDDLWFGDPLLAVGRSKTLLMAMGCDVFFVDEWCNVLGLTDQEMEIIDVYALLYCLRFMGTVGSRLNGNPSVQTDPKKAQRFEKMADKFLDQG
jgi:aminoglycoside phosphotransferase (APT) family kinase protein